MKNHEYRFLNKILISNPSLVPTPKIGRRSRTVRWGKMDSESLDYLLRGGHYNVPDRIARGIWPHDPLKMVDLVAHIVSALDRDQWFPYEWVSRVDGEMIDDVIVIEKQATNRFVVRSRRASVYDLQKIGEQSEKVFATGEQAAQYYLKWGLYLPGDLDSWKVIE